MRPAPPTELILVRHGESLANVAAAEADAAGADRIEIGDRDADVALSPAGVEQAEALGKALADLPHERAPEAVWCSPYRRALQTAQYAVQGLTLTDDMVIDERLRDRDLGTWDLVTLKGVHELHPDEARRRDWLGKFYFRPLGGESWTDLALRLRGVLRDLEDRESGRRVLVVAHDAVVLTFRYVCEGLDEQHVLRIGKEEPVRNASVTRIVRDPESATGWRLLSYNDAEHLEELGAPTTHHREDPDVRR